MDLVIKDAEGAPLLLVENKVKSLAERKQLEDYAKKIPKATKRILLTLIEPSFDLDELEPKWCLLKYENLAVELEKWFKRTTIDSSHSVYISDYIEMIKNLSIVAETYFEPPKIRKAAYWFSNQNDDLNSIRFQQTYRKYQAQIFTDDFTGILAETGFKVTNLNDKELRGKRFSGRIVNVSWTLRNNTPCVTIVPCIDKWPSSIWYGIQIQGPQYRRLAVADAYKGIVRANPRDERAISKLWGAINGSLGRKWLFADNFQRENKTKFFNVPVASGGTLRRITTMRNNLCQYSPDAVYQYINVTKDGVGESLGLKDLGMQIVHDINFGFRLLENKQLTPR